MLEKPNPANFIDKSEKKDKIELLEDLELEKQGEVKSIKVVENKELGVRYRETAIELPQRRQEETGIKHIIRRELLPPLPEGFYKDDEGESEFGKIAKLRNDANEAANKEFGFRIEKPLTEADIERQNAFKYGPRYEIEGFKKVYSFLTGGRTDDTDIQTTTFSLPLYYNDKDREGLRKMHIDNLKAQGLYFQKIIPKARAGTQESEYGADFSKDENGVHRIDEHSKLIHAKDPIYARKDMLWTYYGFKTWTGYLRGPAFIFGPKNSSFRNYLTSIIKNPETRQMLDLDDWGSYSVYLEKIANGLPTEKEDASWNIPIIEHPNIKPLRWCNAEIAIIPTRKSLNVLLFEGV